jgi:hypothetical protein
MKDVRTLSYPVRFTVISATPNSQEIGCSLAPVLGLKFTSKTESTDNKELRIIAFDPQFVS